MSPCLLCGQDTSHSAKAPNGSEVPICFDCLINLVTPEDREKLHQTNLRLFQEELDGYDTSHNIDIKIDTPSDDADLT